MHAESMKSTEVQKFGAIRLIFGLKLKTYLHILGHSSYIGELQSFPHSRPRLAVTVFKLY